MEGGGGRGEGGPELHGVVYLASSGNPLLANTDA